MKSVVVFITGQIRNASDNIDNWMENLFHNCNPVFVFNIWNEVGGVDPNKIHLRSLRSIGKKNFEISKCNIYVKKKRVLEDEMKLIQKKLPNALFFVNEYYPEYNNKIGFLEINDDLKKDAHPWWQGSIPVAFLNKNAIDRFEEEIGLEEYNVFCRLQSEVSFTYKNNIDWDYVESSDVLVTSPDTINKNTQVSIKFFCGNKVSFMPLMNAFDRLVKEYKNYEHGQEYIPIGERFLKMIAKECAIDTQYIVRTKVMRERVYPLNPVWINSSRYNKLNLVPEIFDVEPGLIDKIKSEEVKEDENILMFAVENFIDIRMIDRFLKNLNGTSKEIFEKLRDMGIREEKENNTINALHCFYLATCFLEPGAFVREKLLNVARTACAESADFF